MNLLLAPNSFLFWLSLMLSLPIILLACRLAPWGQVFVSQARQHVLFASILVLGLFWVLQVEVRATLAFHPLLMTVTTMIFGWSLAILVGVMALLVLEFFQLALRSTHYDWDVSLAQFDLSTVPVDFLLSVALPVSWTWIMLWLIDRWKYKNPFTYFLGVGFFGAMASSLLMGLAALLLFSFSASEVQLAMAKEHFMVFVLLMFPEGFSNGAIATVMAVLWPDILKTYNDDWYVNN